MEGVQLCNRRWNAQLGCVLEDKGRVRTCDGEVSYAVKHVQSIRVFGKRQSECLKGPRAEGYRTLAMQRLWHTGDQRHQGVWDLRQPLALDGYIAQ